MTTCRHSKTWVYILGYCMAFVGGYSLHSRIVSDSQYRIERRDGKPYLVDRSTSEYWQIDRKLIDQLYGENRDKANANLENKTR